MTIPEPLVLVYKGRGVGPLTFRETLASLKVCLPKGFHIRSCPLEALIEGSLLQQAALFVLPGGRDVPYDEDLRGSANANLRRFVQGGGGFLGICAGAYYGAARVAFELGYPLEVVGPRELAFFPGDAVGTVYQPGSFVYDSEECARTARIRVGEDHLDAYYNGGCYFKDALAYSDTVKILGYYSDAPVKPLPAIVSCQIGRGLAILSGVHLDYRPECLRGRPSEHLIASLQASDHKRQRLLTSLLHQLMSF